MKFSTVFGASSGKNSIRISPPFSSAMTPVCFTRVPFSSGRDLDRLHAGADLDAVDDLHAADHPTERGVLPVEMAGGPEHDVELAARRVGIVPPRHAEDTALELPAVELRVDRVARPARAHIGMVHRQRLRLRIAGSSSAVSSA